MKHLLLIASTAALVLSTAGAFAETVAAPPATMANNLKVKFIDQQTTDRLASKLIGSDIRNNADASIGSISDIVFDESNKVRAFVVSVGGFLGVGNKYVAVDPSVVSISVGSDGKPSVKIDTDKDQLKAAPEYRYLSEQKSENK